MKKAPTSSSPTLKKEKFGDLGFMFPFMPKHSLARARIEQEGGDSAQREVGLSGAQTVVTAIVATMAVAIARASDLGPQGRLKGATMRLGLSGNKGKVGTFSPSLSLDLSLVRQL